MANLSNVTYTANGATTQFVVPFSYLDVTDITVTLDGVTTTDYTWSDANTIEFSVAPSVDVVVYISRDSNVTQRVVSYADGSSLTEEDLNNQADQSIFLQQETRDLIDTINADNASVVGRVEQNEADIVTNAEAIDAKVTGAASSTDNAIPRFDSTTGKIIQNSGVIINDTDDISGVGDLDSDGTVTISKSGSEDAIVVNRSGTGDAIKISKSGSGKDIVVNTDEFVVDDGDVSISGDITIGGNISVTGTVDGRDIATDGSKLDGIEALADVTDATNVAAAGAVMESDTSTTSMSFVIDEDDMVSDSATKVPTQQSVKAYADTKLDATDLTTERTASATLENKTFDDEVTMKEIATPTTPAAGYKKIYPKSDGKLYTLDDAGTETEVGSGGGGGLDVFYTESFEDTIGAADFGSGNNAAFNGGGTLDGTLSDETVSPISKTSSLKYTMGASSTNDYIISPAITIDEKQKSQLVGLNLYFTYDGNDDDIKVVAYDSSNSVVLTSELVLLKSSTKAQRFAAQFTVPANCTELKYGFQVVTGNSGSILLVDDIELTVDPIVSKFNQEENVFSAKIANNGTATIVSQSGLNSSGQNAIESVSRTALGTVVITYTTGFFTQIPSINVSPDIGGNRIAQSLTSSTSSCTILTEAATTAADQDTPFSIVFTRQGSDYRQPTDQALTYNSQNAKNSMVRLHTGNGHGSTNTKIRRFSTVVDNIGSAITYTDSATDGASFSINEDGVYMVSYTDSSSVSAAAMGLSLNSNQLTTNIFDITENDKLAFLNTTQADFEDTVSWSGILSKGDVVRAHGNGVVNATSGANSCLFTITKIGVNDLLGVPIPQTAYIKDVKPSGTNGGTFTSGAWQTRDLNTVEGDTSIVSLSTNQFTLAAGKYEIEVEAIGYKVNQHKIKLFNITDGIDTLLGTSEVSGSAEFNSTRSKIIGTITLTSTKTYEIQHRCQTTFSSGFGQSSSFGVNEEYTQVKITKIP